VSHVHEWIAYGELGTRIGLTINAVEFGHKWGFPARWIDSDVAAALRAALAQPGRETPA
jgi:hypothetical protein